MVQLENFPALLFCDGFNPTIDHLQCEKLFEFKAESRKSENPIMAGWLKFGMDAKTGILILRNLM